MNLRRFIWGALATVTAVVAVGLLTRATPPLSAYSFLLTDWFSRPEMVSQCMAGLDRAPNPQDQEVWKAAGLQDPATQPYLGRLRYCYEGFRGWQRALRPPSG